MAQVFCPRCKLDVDGVYLHADRKWHGECENCALEFAVKCPGPGPDSEAAMVAQLRYMGKLYKDSTGREQAFENRVNAINATSHLFACLSAKKYRWFLANAEPSEDDPVWYLRVPVTYAAWGDLANASIMDATGRSLVFDETGMVCALAKLDKHPLTCGTRPPIVSPGSGPCDHQLAWETLKCIADKLESLMNWQAPCGRIRFPRLAVPLRRLRLMQSAVCELIWLATGCPAVWVVDDGVDTWCHFAP